MDSRAVLALENGMLFEGTAIGVDGLVVGEVVFNTSITGYQEILTDPSYARQIITLTHPHIGNTGVNLKDEESRVELNGRRADLHKVTLGSQISSDLRCLQRDLLAQTTLLLRIAAALDITKEQDELLQPVAR